MTVSRIPIVIETRAIQQAILHLSKVIGGREVIIYSDHKPLTTCKKPSENIEVEMLMQEVARRGMRILYRKGSKNELADSLSRATCKSLKVSEEDRIVQTLKLWRTLYDKENDEGDSIEETIDVVDEGVVSEKIKEVPEEIKKVFQRYHDQLGHPSYERSFIMVDKELGKLGKSISRKKVRKMYREFLKQCEVCARLRERRKDREGNLGRHEKLSLEAMDELQMDLIGPVKGRVNDYQHSTDEIYRKLMERVVGIFGMPRIFTSDKAKSFEGLKNKGIPISFGCAHHHESQALIERTFRTIEKCFKAMALQMNESSWDNLTAMVCLNYNLSHHTVLRERPAKLFLGYVPRQFFEDGEDVSNKYDYPLERQNEIEKARRVSYEILKALQESPTPIEKEFRIGQKVKMKEAARNQTKFEPPQIYVITEVKSPYVYLKVEGTRGRPLKRYMKDILFFGYVPQQFFEDGEDVSNKYDYSLERQNEIEKARRVSYEILKALQESPTPMEREFRIGQKVKMKEATRNQTKFEPSQVYVITETPETPYEGYRACLLMGEISGISTLNNEKSSFMGKLNLQDQFVVGLLRRLATDCGIRVILVVHPRKIPGEAKVELLDAGGSGKITQDVDNVIAIIRKTHPKELAIVRKFLVILKNRYGGRKTSYEQLEMIYQASTFTYTLIDHSKIDQRI
uniref:Integrase catalytic domain-containing protein n=1 Tax=Strongyloides papillosus TaxID=174720 RepID=A0A0N5C952_STREA